MGMRKSKILIFTTVCLEIIAIVLIVYRLYTHGNRITTLEGKVEVLEELTRNLSDRGDVHLTGNGKVLTIKESEGVTELVVRGLQKDVRLMSYSESQEGVDICGISFASNNGIVISNIDDEVNISRVKELSEKGETEIEFLKGKVEQNSSSILEIEKIAGNVVKSDDFVKSLSQVKQGFDKINSTVSDTIVHVNDRLSSFSSDVEGKIKDITEGLNATITSERKNLKKNLDDVKISTCEYEKQINQLGEDLNGFKRSLSNIYKCVARVSINGIITVLNTSNPSVKISSTKEKNSSVYTVFFDKECVIGYPIVNIIPEINGPDVLMVNIIRFKENEYIQYRISSVISGKERPADAIVTIEALK